MLNSSQIGILETRPRTSMLKDKWPGGRCRAGQSHRSVCLESWLLGQRRTKWATVRSVTGNRIWVCLGWFIDPYEFISKDEIPGTNTSRILRMLRKYAWNGLNIYKYVEQAYSGVYKSDFANDQKIASMTCFIVRKMICQNMIATPCRV